MGDREFVLFAQDGHLAVRGRDGSVVRLPLTGDGAVAALAPYRYVYSAGSGSSGSGQGTVTWAGWNPPAGGFVGRRRRRDHVSYGVGVFIGRWWQRGFAFARVTETGTVALDRGGRALLRIRPLRGGAEVRRVAAACGLAFVEEQVTDPQRLGQAPEMVTRPLLSTGMTRMIGVISFLPAALVAVVVFNAVGGGSLTQPNGNAFFAAAVAGGFSRYAFLWLFRGIGERLAS